jgi:predicted transposase/invertase (TIGR01784 family)
VLFPEASDLHLDFRLRTRPPTLELTSALQVHLLELPKYALPSDNDVITDPIQQWAYFFRQAAELTPQQLADRLGDEVFDEAAGVLEMIARSPRERELYEARLKMQRDEQSRIEAAEERGEARGRSEGRLIGRVQLLQTLLGLPESSDADLAIRTIDQLAQLESDLQRQLRERG